MVACGTVNLMQSLPSLCSCFAFGKVQPASPISSPLWMTGIARLKFGLGPRAARSCYISAWSRDRVGPPFLTVDLTVDRPIVVGGAARRSENDPSWNADLAWASNLIARRTPVSLDLSLPRTPTHSPFTDHCDDVVLASCTWRRSSSSYAHLDAALFWVIKGAAS